MLIFSVWPELVKLPNLHLIRPNTLFLLWACTSGRQREKRAMAPTPPPFPIPQHFVLCRDREATLRATARVCQVVTLAAPVVVKSAGSAPTTHYPLLRPRFSTASSTTRSDNGTSSPQSLAAPPEASVLPASNKSTPAPSGTTSQVRLIFPSLRMSI